MANLTIRKLDDGVHARLKRQAAENHRSLEAEARAQLSQTSQDATDWIEELREFGQRMREKYGVQPDSLELIRQIRDEG